MQSVQPSGPARAVRRTDGPLLYARAHRRAASTEAGAAHGPGEVRVRRALLSVSDKRGVVDFARGLAELGVELVSTGGTARRAARAPASRSGAIEDFTGFPEIMDGRVKTLHPKLYAGLLARARRPGAPRARPPSTTSSSSTSSA